MIIADEQVMEQLTDRLDGIRDFLRQNREILNSHKHLDEGSSERAYWHAGYASALADILNLVSGARKPS